MHPLKSARWAALLLALAAGGASASDVSSWSQEAAENNAAPPNGWPSVTMLSNEVAPAAREIMAAVKRWRDRATPVLTSGGTANAQTLTYTVAPAAYVAGDTYSFIAGATNTGDATINVNSLGVKSIKNGSAALVGGEIISGMVTTVVYDGTNFRLVGKAERVMPIHFGAVGDGVADDTTAVQAAIDAMAGKTLYLGPYRYSVNALISYKPIRLIGETRATADLPTDQQYGLIGRSTNIDLLTLSNDGSTSASGSIIDGVYLDTRAAGASTSGAALVNYATLGVQMRHVRMDIGCIGLDERYSVINKFESGSIRNSGAALPAGCGGIRVGEQSTAGQLTDFHISNTHIDAAGEYSVLVKDAGGMFITGSDFLFATRGTVIKPEADQKVMWLTASHTYLGDSTCVEGLSIDTGDATASVTGLSFNQTWTSSAGTGVSCDGPGVSIQNTGGGTINGVYFAGHRSINNSTHGVVIQSGVQNVSFDKSQICNNAVERLTTPGNEYAGISLGDGAAEIAIRDNRIGANCVDISATSTLQSPGISFVGDSSDIIVIGNDLRGASTGGIAGSAPTGETIIKDNVGVDTINTNVAAGASIAAPLGPIITMTGSGATISNMTGMWDGREARVYMRDGGNTFATGGTTGTNFCNGGTFAQFTVATLYKVPGADCISVK